MNITDPDKASLKVAKLVEAWQERLAALGISHFIITAVHLVDETPGECGAEASVGTPDHYDTAEFWFTWGFLEEASPYDLDRTIIHEWLHLSFRDLDFVLEGVQEWVTYPTYRAFDRQVDHEREGLIDRFSHQIADQHYAAQT